MNLSGKSVQQITRFYQIASEDVVVVCDDMNLPLGTLRWRASGSSGGQKGLADILQRLGTDQVPRLRLGVGRPPGQMEASNWVLARFRSDERSEAEIMTKVAADSVECWAADGLVTVMNSLINQVLSRLFKFDVRFSRALSRFFLLECSHSSPAQREHQFRVSRSRKTGA